MSEQLVRHIRKFIDLPDAEVPVLQQYLVPVSLKKKEYLLREGQYCRSWYYLERGCMRLYFISEKGTEQITQFVIENWWVSDYVSFDRQEPSGFFIQAIEASELVGLERESQEQLCRQIPAMEHYFRIILQKAYAAAQLRFKYLYDFSREEMYYHFSDAFPEFVQRVAQYMLASYLGFTPEYLSGLRKKRSLG